MKKLSFAVLIVVITVVAVSCVGPQLSQKNNVLESLSQGLIKDYKLEPLLKRTQWFSSGEPIILVRLDTIKKANVYGGRLLLNSSDTVYIRPNTPGVCIRTEDGKMFVVFGDDNTKFLTYGPGSGDDPYKNYVLYTLKGTKDVIRYGKDLYTVVSGIGTGIMFDPQEVKTARVESGREVDK